MSTVAAVLGWLTTLTTIASYTTGLVTCRQILRRGSAAEFSLFPYVAMCASCSIWLKYGLLRMNGPLIIVNTTGLLLETIVLFFFYAFSSSKMHLYKQVLLGCLFVFPALCFVRFVAPTRSLQLQYLGFYCTLMSILSYGSPLAAIGHVFSSKSSATMSLPLSLINFLVGLEWSAYGGLLHDVNIVLPNVIGTMLSLFQLSLFLIYPGRPKNRTFHRQGKLIALEPA